MLLLLLLLGLGGGSRLLSLELLDALIEASDEVDELLSGVLLWLLWLLDIVHDKERERRKQVENNERKKVPDSRKHQKGQGERVCLKKEHQNKRTGKAKCEPTASQTGSHSANEDDVRSLSEAECSFLLLLEG